MALTEPKFVRLYKVLLLVISVFGGVDALLFFHLTSDHFSVEFIQASVVENLELNGGFDRSLLYLLVSYSTVCYGRVHPVILIEKLLEMGL